MATSWAAHRLRRTLSLRSSVSLCPAPAALFSECGLRQCNPRKVAVMVMAGGVDNRVIISSDKTDHPLYEALFEDIARKFRGNSSDEEMQEINEAMTTKSH